MSSEVLSEGHPLRRALVPLAVLLSAGMLLARLLLAQRAGAVDLSTGSFVLVAVSICVVWPVGQWYVLRRLVGEDLWAQAWATLAVVTIGWYPWLTLTTLAPRDVVALSFIPVAIGLVLDGRLRGGPRRVLQVAGGLVVLVLVALALRGVSSRSPEPAAIESSAQAAGEVLLGTALRLPPAWVGAALVLCGMIGLVVTRRWRSLPAVHVLLGVLYVFASAPWIPYLGYASWTALPPAAVFVAGLGVTGSLLAGAGAASLLTLTRASGLGRWPTALLCVAALAAAVVLADTGLITGIVAGLV
ncbi:hypothetical protein EQW78_07870 [Oerskovia turbata]|uniref:Uncharacterized protein n=1 Tax=Oerskovia turbata TaxID=1713 RepID=A0A4Q1KVX9_9CELL|nr:hypothetical protein [Oerskovia turbata]RXR26738.1 hypothetical protein EQW73_04375 [Oerskovia turbata]RXR34471.1 hypothetical protein EQW78_07870 [Oerskovia turbata]TGJ97749.1 hypothetical protein DLJ96_07465 [Actinotalea fermentans ATCC 43279 = JCM 9966 = DSM 3133]